MSADDESGRGLTLPRGLAIFAGLFPALASLLITVLLIVRSNLAFTGADAQTMTSLGLIALFLLAGLAVGYALRLLLPSPAPPPRPTGDDSTYHRDRLARYVVTAGTIGIFVTALTIIIAVAIRADGEEWVQTALAIFTSVLPVFATWVGTVLAFYFTNESFRQAAEATQALTGRKTGSEPITRAGTMVGFDAITRLELDPAAVAAQGAAAAAEAVMLSDIETLFGPTGTNRVVIFDDARHPIFVIRRSEMPPAVAATDTVTTYLETGTNRVAAVNFDRVAASTTVADARRLIESRRVTDLFVTQNGQADEPTIGWVPDENLSRA